MWESILTWLQHRRGCEPRPSVSLLMIRETCKVHEIHNSIRCILRRRSMTVGTMATMIFSSPCIEFDSLNTCAVHNQLKQYDEVHTPLYNCNPDSHTGMLFQPRTEQNGFQKSIIKSSTKWNLMRHGLLGLAVRHGSVSSTVFSLVCGSRTHVYWQSSQEQGGWETTPIRNEKRRS